jgi:predicted PurR-regulated permease PerM
MIQHNNIERFFGLLALFLLALGVLVVLRPFVTAILWAMLLVYTTWPLYLRVRHALGEREGLAAMAMMLLLTVVIVLPVTILGVSLTDNVASVGAKLHELMAQGLPDPPGWLAGIPLVGDRVDAQWRTLAHDSAKLNEELRGLLDPIKNFLLSGGLKIGQGLLSLVLSVVLTFFFYRDGERVGAAATNVLSRIGGERAGPIKQVAGLTVRGVVYGILGTALAQAVLAAFGLWLAGIPGWLLWGACTFFLSVVPVGPPMIWIPASLWLLYQGSTGWAIFLALWGFFVVSSIDNVIKPYLISRGSNLPFLLTLLGVLGGALAFGFIGVFLGPTLLAVGHSVLLHWLESSSPGEVTPPHESPPSAS